MLNFYKSICVLLLLTLYACSGSSTLTKSDKLTRSEIALIKQLENNEQSFTGFILLDPASSDTLISYNHDRYFTPASNTKILTLFASMLFFSDSIPSFRFINTDSAVHLLPLADPSLLNSNLSESDHFLSFLKKNDKPIIIHLPESRIPEKFGAGWSWDDYSYYYQAEKTIMPLYGNCLNIDYDTLSGWKTYPDGNFKIDIKTNPSQRRFLTYRRDVSENVFEILLNSDPIRNVDLEIPITWNNDLLVDLVKDTLGLNVDKDSEFSNAAFWNTSSTFYNVHADSIYKRLMKVSDNFIAEQLLLGLAAKISDTVQTEIALDFVLKKNLKNLPDKIQWVDGSGLSRYNLTTPRNTIYVLHELYKMRTMESLMHIFPAGGESGTIKSWYGGFDKPYVFAKTGTLRNKHALSGFLKADSGKVYIFSFMHENYVNGTRPVKEQMEAILLSIKKSY